MRRTAVRLLSISAVPLILLTGCGSSSKPTTATSLSDIKVNTANAKKPTVSIPKGGFKAGSQTTTQVITQGTGAALGSKQIAYVDYVAYNGTKNKQLVNTFGQRFVPIPLADTSQLPGLVKSLVGKKVGTTQKVAIPASQGFGSAGNTALGVASTDTLVFYIKIDAAADALTQPTGSQATPQAGFKVSVPAGTNKQATITVPSTAPKTLLIQSLITGTGVTTATGDYVTVSYTGINLRTKKVFDASAKTGQPATFQLATGAITGFVKGLTGKTVGSRVLISIPPAQGYGTTGNTQAGIKGTDTIAFVVDILAIVPQPAQSSTGN